MEPRRLRGGPISLRLRLALLYSSLLALVFAVTGTVVLTSLRRTLIRQVDLSLRTALTQALDDIDYVDGLPTLGADGTDDEDRERVSTPGLDGPESADTAVRILTADGAVRGGVGPYDSLPVWSAPPGSSTRRDGKREWRLYNQRLVLRGDATAFWMQAAQSLGGVERTVGAMRRFLLAGLPVLLALSAGAVWVLSGRAVRPILEIAATASTINGNELTRRIGYHGSTVEVARLAASFDRMLDRLEEAFARERRFVADAAHELRTPLAALKGQIEVALGRPRTDREYRRSLRGLRGSVDRLIRLSADLLLMARIGQASQRQARAAISVGDLLDAVLDSAAPATRRKRLVLDVRHREPAVVRGDMDELIRLFLNLVENAARYTPEGGRVDVAVASEDGFARVDIVNSGPGIPAADLPRVFEPFYRIQSDRSRETGGAGLGLSIAREIAHKHGGKITATSEPGAMTTFTVLLPLSR